MRIPNYLEDLGKYVPVLSAAQIQAHYFRGDRLTLRRELSRAKADGLVELSVELVRRRQDAGSPIANIRLGDAIPSVRQIISAANWRWPDVVNPCLVVRGTAKLAALVGGGIHTAIKANVSHDIALADVFLSKRADPNFEWTLVHSKPGGGAMPDAVAADGMIEVIGRYNGSSIAAKIALAGKMKLEIW